VLQGSYFSEYTRESSIESDESTYQLIMNKKERLLSFEEPTEFIFSHSALREGWDNPNVFQICTLNRTVSTMRKRQEIGRGMRLAVDQDGRRVFDSEINTLTVVANQSYAEYVDQLQHEYQEDLGPDETPPDPENGRKRRTVELKDDFELDPHFQELWSKVSKRARYRINIDSSDLIETAADAVAAVDVPELNITVTTGQIDEISEDGTLNARQVGQGQDLAARRIGEIPNVTAEIAERTDLTRRTVRQILERAGNLAIALQGPFEYIERVSTAINEKKRKFLVDGVHYLELGDAYEMALFQNMESYQDNIVPIKSSIYDHVVFDSEVEKKFALAIDDMDEVRLFIKLPGWFTVTTPVGEYNPDWAIMLQTQDEFGEAQDRIALVRETKSTKETQLRRPTENDKVNCARRHFATIDVDFDDITDAKHLRDTIGD
jgi:type III restriction enzyme